jgi:SAM-dependent methyltransferase
MRYVAYFSNPLYSHKSPHPLYRKSVDKYLKGLSGPALDLGSGNGHNGAYARDLGMDVTFVDPDPEAAKVARKMFGIDTLPLSAESYPFQPETLSHVNYFNSAMYLSPGDQRKVLFRIQDALVPGGVLTYSAMTDWHGKRNVPRNDEIIGMLPGLDLIESQPYKGNGHEFEYSVWRKK